MNLRVNSRYEQMTLGISVVCARPTKVRLKITDAEKPLTCFTNRYKTVNHSFKFYATIAFNTKNLEL